MSSFSTTNNTSSTASLDVTSWRFFEKLILITLYTILLSVGLFGNGAVAIIILRCKKMQTSTNWLILNLTIVNIFIVSVIVPYSVISPHFNWKIGDTACRYIMPPLVDHFSGIGMLIYVTTAFGRCIIIKYGSEIPKKPMMFLSSWPWIVAFFSFSMTRMGALGKYRITEDNGKVRCNFDYNPNGRKNYLLVIIPLFYIIPCFITLYLHIRIQMIYRTSLRRDATYLPDATFISRQRKRSRMNYILRVMFILFICSTLPYKTLVILRYYEQISAKVRFEPGRSINDFLQLIFYSQSLINPLLLLFMNKEYRRKMFEIPLCHSCFNTKLKRKPATNKRKDVKIEERERHKSTTRQNSVRKISTYHSPTNKFDDVKKQRMKTPTITIDKTNVSSILSKKMSSISVREYTEPRSDNRKFRRSISLTTPAITRLKFDELRSSESVENVRSMESYTSLDTLAYMQRKLSTKSVHKTSYSKKYLNNCQSSEGIFSNSKDVSSCEGLHEARFHGNMRKISTVISSRNFSLSRRPESPNILDKVNRLESVFSELNPRSGYKSSIASCRSLSDEPGHNAWKFSFIERKFSSHERKRSTHERKRSTHRRLRPSEGSISTTRDLNDILEVPGRRRKNLSFDINILKNDDDKTIPQDNISSQTEASAPPPTSRRTRKKAFVLGAEKNSAVGTHERIVAQLNMQQVQEKWESNGNFNMKTINVDDVTATESIYMNDANIYDLLLSASSMNDITDVHYLYLNKIKPLSSFCSNVSSNQDHAGESVYCGSIDELDELDGEEEDDPDTSDEADRSNRRYKVSFDLLEES